MRTLAVVLLIGLIGCGSSAPMPEYAAAVEAYKATLDKTLDSSEMDPAFAAVAAQLHAVPSTNAGEKRKAEALAAEIDAAQAKRKGFEAVANEAVPPPPSLPPDEPPPADSGRRSLLSPSQMAQAQRAQAQRDAFMHNMAEQAERSREAAQKKQTEKMIEDLRRRREAEAMRPRPIH